MSQPYKCPTCYSYDREKRRMMPHPTENALCNNEEFHTGENMSIPKTFINTSPLNANPSILERDNDYYYGQQSGGCISTQPVTNTMSLQDVHTLLDTLLLNLQDIVAAVFNNEEQRAAVDRLVNNVLLQARTRIYDLEGK
jgi:hypothetical protein